MPKCPFSITKVLLRELIYVNRMWYITSADIEHCHLSVGCSLDITVERHVKLTVFVCTIYTLYIQKYSFVDTCILYNTNTLYTYCVYTPKMESSSYKCLYLHLCFFLVTSAMFLPSHRPGSHHLTP